MKYTLTFKILFFFLHYDKCFFPLYVKHILKIFKVLILKTNSISVISTFLFSFFRLIGCKQFFNIFHKRSILAVIKVQLAAFIFVRDYNVLSK